MLNLDFKFKCRNIYFFDQRILKPKLPYLTMCRKWYLNNITTKFVFKFLIYCNGKTCYCLTMHNLEVFLKSKQYYSENKYISYVKQHTQRVNSN